MGTKELIEKLNTDKDFAQEFGAKLQAKRDAGAGDAYEAFIPVAAEYGYDVKPGDIDDLQEKARAELSEEELGKVAGGTSCISMTLPVTLATILISVTVTADEIDKK